MLQPKLVRLGALIVLTGVPLLAASAQTSTPTAPPPGASPPSATTPAPTPMPPKAVTPKPADKSATTAPGKANALVGLAVFSSDGSKMGSVHAVSTGPDSAVKAILIKTGGFLGFGGRLVSIPQERFTMAGNIVQLGMTADEVGKLPAAKEQS